MLRIFVVSHNGSPPATPLSATFNEEGSIGRDDINTLVLEEPDKHLSRIQALVRRLGGEYFLLDQGGNPCIVNGRPVGKGKVATLRPGDRIKMAGWVLQVAPVAPVATAPAALPPLSATQASLERMLQKPAPQAPARKPAAEMGTATVLMLPEQFAQYGDGGSWGGAGDFLQDDMASDEPVDSTLEQAPDPAENTDAASVRAALMKGLGITAVDDWQLTARHAELLGAIVRESLEGFQHLLKQQALSRKTFQADSDVADSGAHNPIKNSADVAVALHQMLFQKSAENCLDPVAAVQDVVLELHAHHAGVSLAIRGAMAGMLTSFKPEIIEKRLTAGMRQDEPEKHLWERYVQAHPEISRKAEGVFHSTLAQAYRRVYEDQKKRYAASRASSK